VDNKDIKVDKQKKIVDKENFKKTDISGLTNIFNLL